MTSTFLVVQICFIMTMVTMVVRLDAYSVIYGVFLCVLILLPRKKCYYVWPFYVGVLIILILTQYLSCLGLPPGLCYGKFIVLVMTQYLSCIGLPPCLCYGKLIVLVMTQYLSCLCL